MMMGGGKRGYNESDGAGSLSCSIIDPRSQPISRVKKRSPVNREPLVIVIGHKAPPTKDSPPFGCASKP